jgi:glycine/D-amino acid oxidase-like deaminating enzyme
MQRSIEVFQNADEYLGAGAAQSLAVKQRGYLFCAFTPKQAEILKADVALLHSLGLTHIEYLDSSEVAYRYGWLGGTVIAAKFDPVAGWLDSNALIHAFARSARSAQIVLDAAETRLIVSGGRVTGVQLPGGTIATDQVVIAAGAGSMDVARTIGIELPVVLRPRQSFTTGWRHAAFPEDAPMVIGAAPHPHVHSEAGTGAIFGWEYTWHNKAVAAHYGDTAEHDAIRQPVIPVTQLKDPRFPSLTLALLARQFGHAAGEGFADPRYLRSISHNIGYYVCRDETAAYRVDHSGQRIPYASERAILDAWPGVDGLFVSIAHVGHGIMSSPAAGEILARRLLGLPQADPTFADFGLDVPWVAHDEGVL